MDMSRTDEAVRIEPASILRIIWIITAVVLTLGYLREIIGTLHGLPASGIPFPFISLNSEASIASWWSSIMLATSGVLMLFVGSSERARAIQTGLGWYCLGAGFLYASMDEASELHERFGHGLQHFPDPTGGLFTFRWVIVGAVIVLFAGLVFLPFLRRLPRETAGRLIVAGTIFVSGAIGTEMLGGIFSATRDSSFTYQALFMLEETLEMLGTILGIRAVLLHIDEQLGGPALRIASAP